MSRDARIWQFYKKHPDNTRYEKRAICKLCAGVYSYTATSHNLKLHLGRAHPNAASSLGINGKSIIKKAHKYYRTYYEATKAIWTYFSKVQSNGGKIAVCNLCKETSSYSRNNNELSEHLATSHPEFYAEWLQKKPLKINNDVEQEIKDKGDEDESPKLEDVLWGYFEREGDGQARCVVCQETVSDSHEELNRHMEENHPKLIGHIPGDEDRTSVGSNDADDDNTFTEVVYLEQDALQDIETHQPNETQRRSERRSEKPKAKIFQYGQKSEKIPIKKRHRASTSSDDYPVRKKERRDEPEDDELTIFLKYIKCLLQKLSKEAFSKVQVDIVNHIINAQNNSYVELPKASVGNVVAVNEVTGINSGHNYSITVAPCTSKSEVTANSQTNP